MAGPARYQSFFDWLRNALKKSRGFSMGRMSGTPATKMAAVAEASVATGRDCSDSWFWFWSSTLDDRSGSCSFPSSMGDQRNWSSGFSNFWFKFLLKILSLSRINDEL